MKSIFRLFKTMMVGIALTIPVFPVFSQDAVIEIDPLFDYPVAPEELKSIEDKSNYLVEHFWDPMDFKTKATVDQHALNAAFSVYTVPMKWADKQKSLTSADKLIEKLSKNPILLAQFLKAAEENLYGPRAEVWIDEIYVKFLQALVKSKKSSAKKKNKYKTQLDVLTGTMVGKEAPEFKFIGTDGKEHRYFPMSTPTLLIFGNPSLADWRMWRLKLETNTTLVKAIDKGQVNVIFIVESELPGWNKEVSSYPSKWIVGCAPDINETYDLRTEPAFYVIDADGKIVLKNSAAETALAKLLEIIQTPTNN